VFNPASFYYVFTASDDLLCTVAEVNNTFGERHVYLPRRMPGDPEGFPARFMAPKGFHVSPFNDMEGIYEFAFGDIRNELDIRIDIRLTDYRHIEGRFNRIVPIEMVDAVGHQRLTQFFRCSDRLLKPGGIMALQTITIPDERYDDYRQETDWIRKHIFPGGHLPSPGAIRAAATGQSSLTILEMQEIGPHYTRTLREWRNRFLAQTPAIQRLGLGRSFQRKWLYYLASCEGGFAAGATGDLQIVIAKGN
jgi:cyclopropane-fatty-acyl-phospholipid synthase